MIGSEQLLNPKFFVSLTRKFGISEMLPCPLHNKIGGNIWQGRLVEANFITSLHIRKQILALRNRCTFLLVNFSMDA